ncbi:hypothetical protein [Streptomyces sp. SID13031]|uniref:hypothetical protein n=1 Tax=Streptomyces sp. SID13031 TaxID=2706046 RepID=UPI0013CD478F|nr:hypothetical protein [Streptomyces sp. SID13031]NEA37298.1 hypothetical protein [Streptomyces sp. SID13031]
MWKLIVIGVGVLALIGSCFGGSSSSGPDDTYTPEACTALLLVANNNGNVASEQTDAAIEYNQNCR